MEEHDSGRTAMWICGALLGFMQHRGIVNDGEISALARDLEREAESADPAQQTDMLRAARWFRRSVGPAND